jgi:nucleoside-diphosphate-sugar epimerase
MRVFVTGATGYIGSAIVRELTGAGHDVVGLARSDQAAAALTAAGAAAHRGALEDHESLRTGAATAEGVIHNAFKNVGPDTDFAAACEADLRAIETLGEALADSGRPFVVTSGTAALAPLGRLGTESDTAVAGFPRSASEDMALSFAGQGVRASVVRLAPSVHGHTDKKGFVPSLIGLARETGVSGYVGDGANRWPAVHVVDAARLFRAALEQAPAGARLHGVGEEGVAFRDIATAIGWELSLPVTSIPADEAVGHFSWLAMFVSLDNPTASLLTRTQLGWQPEHRGLIADIEEGHYFKN